MMIMCKYKFVNWNKWITLGGDVDKEGGYVCVAEGSLEKMPNQYVELEVLTGLESPVDLAEARNTSVAVDLKTIEELKK